MYIGIRHDNLQRLKPVLYLCFNRRYRKVMERNGHKMKGGKLSNLSLVTYTLSLSLPLVKASFPYTLPCTEKPSKPNEVIISTFLFNVFLETFTLG